jgi:hypothetical protein
MMKKHKEAEKLWALNHFPISQSGRGWWTSGRAQLLSQFLNNAVFGCENLHMTLL